MFMCHDYLLINHNILKLIFSEVHKHATLHHGSSFIFVGKGKGKAHPRTGREGPEGEWRCSSTLSLTSPLDGDGWSTPLLDRFNPGKGFWYEFIGGWVGPQDRTGRVRKISPAPGFDSRTVQSVASRFTDSAVFIDSSHKINVRISICNRCLLQVDNSLCLMHSGRSGSPGSVIACSRPTHHAWQIEVRRLV